MLLTVRHLSKSFPGVKALQNVQLTLQRGEVHGLMGENGAGKSTLMKILMGLETADEGQIFLDGKEVRSGSVRDSLRHGISMIHQEMLTVPELTVAQNIFLGKEARGGFLNGFVNDRAMYREATTLLQRLGSAIDPQTPMKYLSVAEMQVVEIAKAISNEAKIIIMDEPTSALADREAAVLFNLIKDLKQQGVSILYTSHKMDEVFALCDTVTVLRDGQFITSCPTSDLTEASLISLMVGREINSLYPESITKPGPVLLSVRSLSSNGRFSDISFDVHRGEVLGIGGLMGAGRTEIARAIFGLDPFQGGEIVLNGQTLRIQNPRDAIRQGIGYVSEDRKGFGFIPGLSVRENLTLASLFDHSASGFIQPEKEEDSATHLMTNLNIRASDSSQPVGQLSGGNQQKVVIGKTLLARPQLLILDEPTRGIDIGARHEIYKLIRQLTADGLAIILISSDLPELLGLSDRILVIANGQQTALLTKAEASQEIVMTYAM